MTSLVVLTSLFLLVGAVEFPNPQREWRMCGRAKPSHVCDPDLVLDRGDVERLDQIAHDLRKSTSCLCSTCAEGDGGVMVGIFIKHNVSQDSLSKYPTGNALSEMLRRRWSLSKCDSDIVIVVLSELNITGYSLGQRLRPLLPLTTADHILADCRVHFESGFHYQGLESVLNSFEDVITMNQRQGPNTFKNLLLGIGLGFGVMLVLALLALVLVHRQQVDRRKSNCEDILQTSPRNNNRRRPSFDQEDHLEKLKHLNSIEDEEDDDIENEEFLPSTMGTTSRRVRGDEFKFVRMGRQLSDVTEESGEDDVSKRNSSFSSSFCSPRGSFPVTEL